MHCDMALPAKLLVMLAYLLEIETVETMKNEAPDGINGIQSPVL